MSFRLYGDLSLLCDSKTLWSPSGCLTGRGGAKLMGLWFNCGYIFKEFLLYIHSGLPGLSRCAWWAGLAVRLSDLSCGASGWPGQSVIRWSNRDLIWPWFPPKKCLVNNYFFPKTENKPKYGSWHWMKWFAAGRRKFTTVLEFSPKNFVGLACDDPKQLLFQHHNPHSYDF